MHLSIPREGLATSPFLPGKDALYSDWRRAKRARTRSGTPPFIPIGPDGRLDTDQRAALLDQLRTHGFALYRLADGAGGDHRTIHALANDLGLGGLDTNPCADADGITSLRVRKGGRHGSYIPYSDRPIGWHTDGYYNPPERRVDAFILHCVRPARSGGVNGLLDPEQIYRRLRDTDPALVEALMEPDAMTIPANPREGREAVSGPVFSVTSTGDLHMRYSHRTRHLEWGASSAIRHAAGELRRRIEAAEDARWLRLEAGEGVLSNNALHCRSGFEEDDEHTRLLLRARYHQRIPGTEEAWRDLLG